MNAVLPVAQGHGSPDSKAAACPSCAAPMIRLPLQGKTGGMLPLDLCHACQGIWFDRFESEQLAPGSIVTLFQHIQAHRDDPKQPLSTTLRCPHCHDRLMSCLDRTRSGRFVYHRCLQQHGRFTLFGQFMIEKGFVRQLAPAEIKAVAARIGTIRCSGCGAPVDIRTEDACPHCGAPIAVLDPEAASRAMAGFQQAEAQRQQIDPEAIADAILARERSRASASHSSVDNGIDIGDLILSGVDMALDLLDH